MLSYLLEREEIGWLKGDGNENTSLGISLAQILSVAYMGKPQKATSSLMEHILPKMGQRLVDFFAMSAVNLFVTEQEPSFMTSDLQSRRF